MTGQMYNYGFGSSIELIQYGSSLLNNYYTF